MSVFDELQGDLKEAMRSGDTVARDTIRLAISALKNRRIEVGKELGDDEATAVLTKQVKTRIESAEQYDQAGREDLAQRERAEIDVLRRYLPKELSEERTREIVQETIDSLGLSKKSELGRVMKEVLGEYRGRVDGKLVQRIASELLG